MENYRTRLTASTGRMTGQPGKIAVIYTHVSTKSISKIKNPLGSLNLK